MDILGMLRYYFLKIRILENPNSHPQQKERQSFHEASVNPKMMKTLDFDRLSELPDSLILEILPLMPMSDVVRTTILSKRWKDLWTTVPCLDFEVKNLVRDRKFIHEVLLRWEGINIRKFKIEVFTELDELAGDLDSWVRFVTEKKVEDLRLNLPFDWSKPLKEPEYRLPQCIYSCSSIKKLWITGCNLEIQEKVQWDKLKSLYLYGRCVSEDVINRIVSSAPRLELFDLRLTRSHHNLKIESNSLKTLLVSKCIGYSRYAKLTIRAPKLESLHLCGNAYSECKLLMNASSLTRVFLRFYEFKHAALEETFRQILPTIRHIEGVSLSPCAFKMLGVMQSMYSLSPFPNVKKLKLDGGPVTPKDIADLARMFPEVETLVVDWILDDWYLYFLKNLPRTTCKDSEAKSSFLKLRTVEIIVYSDDQDPSALELKSSFWREHATMLQMAFIRRGVKLKAQRRCNTNL